MKVMNRFSTMLLATAVFCSLMMVGRLRADDKPDGPPPKQEGGPGGPPGGGPGGPGGPPPGGVHLIPRFALAKLNLTDDQKKQVDELEKDCKAKLAKILTPEQMKILESARPPRGPGGGGQGGRGQGPGGGPGNPPPGPDQNNKPQPPPGN